MSDRSTRLALLLAALLPLAAHGADEARAQAQESFREARRAFDLGKFEAALGGFEAAYALDPRPELLFNIAQAHRHLRHYEQAAFFYRRYLAVSPAPAKNGPLARRLIAEVEREAELERERALELARAQASRPEEGPAESPSGEPPLAAPASPVEHPRILGEPSSPVAPPQAPEAPPLFKRWWFLVGVGVLAAGATTWAVASSGPAPTTQREIRF